MKYIILYLLLDATTGQPLEVGRANEIEYEYEDCERAKAAFGPQSPKEGKVRVFVCATEKQITAL